MTTNDSKDAGSRTARVSLSADADARLDRHAAAHACSRPEVVDYALRALEASANPSIRELLDGIQSLDARVALLADTYAAIFELMALREYAAHEALSALLQKKPTP